VFFFMVSILSPSRFTSLPVMVAERSRAWTIFAHVDARTVGSNPTQGMDV
jgi:hypothetical protein